MRRNAAATAALSLSILLFTSGPASSATMYDYCQVPPYVIQNVVPNVMILLDTSGSMLNFAYYDGFHTDNNAGDDDLCTLNNNPCDGFTDPGSYPGYKYYGYFNPDYWYEYSSLDVRFRPTAPKTGSGLTGARAKAILEWDGNFLNWLTMRRIDIVRKVLTGGKPSANKLSGELADCDARGKYKRIGNASAYTPYDGTRKILVSTIGGTCDGSGSGTSSFTVRNDPGGGDGTGAEGTYNVIVEVPLPVEGVLQSVVGTRARLGLTFFKQNTSSSSTDHGGKVRVSIGGGSLPSTVNEINLSRPDANTPLGEALWTVAGYYARQASILGGPGPRYGSSDYATNNQNDPYNYGTGGNPRFPECAKSFVLLITDGEPCSDGNLPGHPAQDSLADYAGGMGSGYNCTNTGILKDPYVEPDLSLHGSCPAAPRIRGGVSDPFPASNLTVCSAGNYAAGIEDVALWARTTDLRDNPTLGHNNMNGIQNLSLFVVSAFGTGSTILRYAAINGGFEDRDGDMVPSMQIEWDQNGDGEPDTYYEANDGYELEEAVRNALSTMLKRASSGTAASVLASGEGSGANLVQAVFYPRRRIGNEIIMWAGSLQNLWYYVDPFFTNSSIREDSDQDKLLDLRNDDIALLYFDADAEATKARIFDDTDGNGTADVQLPTISFEELKHLWEAGNVLWSRDLSTSPREIHTSVDGTSIVPFSVDNAATLRPHLQAATDNEAQLIIRYVHGEDFTAVDNTGAPLYRNRTVQIGVDNNVWKLGDVVNSTPRISSWIPLNLYDKVYSDTTYAAYVGTTGYRSRGTVFTGGNDGMLHAFKLGRLELKWTGQTGFQKARLENDDPSVPLGTEMWAYVPKNVLPYLRYTHDPEYCHLYGVDLTPFVFDASIGDASEGPDATRTADSWKTIVIGGMRTGGGCRNLGDSCSDCVNTPLSDTGYSAYFALDVTDPDDPKLLWEFTNPQLGFATTGPAVVRIHYRDGAGAIDPTKNGHWFVVFGSGPTGPVDNTSMQFLGRSDQNLRLFVLDLKTGTLERTIDTGVPYAFAGSMLNATADPDKDYQDDAVYLGYTKRTGAAGSYTWTDGGIGRLLTKEDPDPNNWTASAVIDGIGPVTAAVTRLQDKTYSNLWLYFGTGRYFYVQESVTDDATGQRRMFGIKEPCFVLNNLNPECTEAPVDPADLTDVSDIADVPAEATANGLGFKGWFIDLDPASTIGNASSYYAYPPDNVARPYMAERVITDPLTTSTGLAFFTTYKPYAEECALGGKSFIWAVRYNTGGAGGTLLRGKALVQVSTASVEQIDLSSAFQGSESQGGRRSTAMEGVPPTAQGLSLMSPPPPVRRVIHYRER